jgi:hypothetical protein
MKTKPERYDFDISLNYMNENVQVYKEEKYNNVNISSAKTNALLYYYFFN